MASSEIDTRYLTIRSDLRIVLDQCALVSQLLSDQVSTSERQHNAKLIFSKLAGHGISLYRLSPTGQIPAQPGSTEFWDVSSLFCICRALIEAFDALAFVAIEEVSEDERSFRVLLWRLHAEDRKLQALKLIRSERPEVVALDAEVKALRGQLEKSAFYLLLDKSVRTAVVGKKIEPFHIRPPERNRRNRVNHEYYMASYILLSAHTHTYPMALQQLAAFQAGDSESLRLISMPSQYAIGFLSKALLGIQGIFPESSQPAQAEVTDVVETWSQIVENGISGATQ